MVKVGGKGGISATVVADSISESGQPITTFELEYPRFIHAEFMTHRQFSRNAASSRAIPIEKVIEQVENNPAMPIHWGKNQSGMQAKGEVGNIVEARLTWADAADAAIDDATALLECGLHKQIVNRILEPYQMIKVVCTATEYANFFYLRNHADAQPEIAELARVMMLAQAQSKPQTLKPGEWHLPYVDIEGYSEGVMHYSVGGELVSLEDAIKISVSLCAQVSYRKADESLEKALKIYDMLVTMKPVHASPLEHIATPIRDEYDINDMQPHTWEEGITHIDKNCSLWSGNFKGWVQFRQLIKGHVYTGEAS